MINARGILLFVGGKEYYLSYDRYPWFRNAKVSDVLDVTMPDEDSLRWDAIDVDLEIDSIIHPERYPIRRHRSGYRADTLKILTHLQRTKTDQPHGSSVFLQPKSL